MTKITPTKILNVGGHVEQLKFSYISTGFEESDKLVNSLVR